MNYNDFIFLFICSYFVFWPRLLKSKYKERFINLKNYLYPQNIIPDISIFNFIYIVVHVCLIIGIYTLWIRFGNNRGIYVTTLSIWIILVMSTKLFPIIYLKFFDEKISLYVSFFNCSLSWTLFGLSFIIYFNIYNEYKYLNIICFLFTSLWYTYIFIIIFSSYGLLNLQNIVYKKYNDQVKARNNKY